jgi:hypothetical protein
VSAVELRQGKIRRCLAQDLVRLAQLAVLAFERALMRSCSSVVGPGRTPRSRSACLTQWRSVSPEQPIFSAIERIADHCEACSLW